MTTDSGITDTQATTLLMASSAIFLGVLGLGLSFVPDLILTSLGLPTERVAHLLISVLGAHYLGFSGLNWMARYNIIGGIYSRPVAMGNFLHFCIAAIAVDKYVLTNPAPWWMSVLAVAYLAFAGSFGYLMFYGGRHCG